MSTTNSPSSYFNTARDRKEHVLNFRASESLVQQVAAVGRAENLSLSDTLRLLIERGIVASNIPPPTTKEVEQWLKPQQPVASRSGTRKRK